jgi:hypothetical protein
MPIRREQLPKMDEDGPIDYLEEDPEVPTQRYAILSFISPEKVLKQKQEFMNEKFIEWLEYEWKIKGIEKYNAYVAQKYSLKVEDLYADLQAFTKIHNEDIVKTDIVEQYQVFLLKKEKELENQFSEAVEFHTSVRGVKIRRVFADLHEAQTYAKVLQRRYPRDNLFVGKVGAWLPWDPSETMMPEVEYAEKELNEMMRKYKENEVNKEIFFEEEKADKIKKQREENETRRKMALMDAEETEKSRKLALTDAGETESASLQQSIETPVHPAEGGAPRDL